MHNKIKIGISTCLLGQPVRYDGSHKLDNYIVNTLGSYFEFIPICPETECGLGIPREAIQLEEDPSNPRLLTIKTRIDHTTSMKKWSRAKLKELKTLNLSGYIFKSKSPSCGIQKVKIFNRHGKIIGTGSGMFAKMFMDDFPIIPIEDEQRLHDPSLRSSFIERIFTLNRWKKQVLQNKTSHRLVTFHAQHKLLFMSHSSKHLSQLGKIVAHHKHNKSHIQEYQDIMMQALCLQATTKKHVNVLQHIMGYFKKVLSSDEKQELLEIINQFHHEQIPLIVPITLLNHHVRKYNQPYLRHQYYLHPHPIELKLRNHI